MAKIVLGIGTSHSPLLTFDVDTWLERAQDDVRSTALNQSDGSIISYDSLLAERGPKYRSEASRSFLESQAARAEAALDILANEIEAIAPDLVIVVGDDHEELFRDGNTPSLAVFRGPQLVMHPMAQAIPNCPSWLLTALRGCAMDAPHRFEGSASFATLLIEGLMARGIDVASVSKVDDPVRAGLGHAFGFIIRRLLRDKPIPVIPILLNTYYPPNVVRPDRCYEIGRALQAVIANIPGNQRVALVASGGLSHFVTDEQLDRQVLEALRSKDSAMLRQLPVAALQSGSSEILCWVVAAGALEQLDQQWSEYLPVYRTPAGSGIGLGFAIWRT
jgi:Catalytic LigB subunit of aromatic ring-opening dioxygenase